MTATLRVDDAINPVVIRTATITVTNVAPVISTVTAPGGSVAVGAAVPVSALFTDLGTHDTHTATINWGDTATTTATVTESSGSGTAAGSHAYSTSGTYTVKVTVVDDDGGSTFATRTVVVNGGPVVNAGGPYTGIEGKPTKLNATAVDPDGDPMALLWTFTWTGDPGTSCTATGTTTLKPSVTCNDDAVVTATLRVTAGSSPPVFSTATLTVANAAPTVGALCVPVSPLPLGTAASISVMFADLGQHDTHTATVAWGDATTSSGSVTEALGSGSVTGSHVYAAAGTYLVSVTVRDDNGGTVVATATTSVVVYDRPPAFVTGGGWITSPSGAYTPTNSSDPDLTGRGNFGFVARQNGAGVPTGETEFQLRVRNGGCRPNGNDDHGCDDDDRWDDDRWNDCRMTSTGFDFHSIGYTSLLVSNGNTKAIFRGTGTVNGVGGYEFLVSVIDGRSTHSADRFRIKVWKTSTGVVIYDNQFGALDDATATAAVSGGSIVIH